MGEELTLFQRAILLSLSQIFLLAFGRRAEYWSTMLYRMAIAGSIKARDIELLK